MNKIGCHISLSKLNGYLPGAVESAIEYGCNTMMIFLGPPHSAKRVDKNLYNKELYYSSNLSSKIKPIDIIAHAPYIINCANPEKAGFSTKILISEMERLNYIGGKFIVLHPGSNPDTNLGIQTCARVIRNCLNSFKNVVIAIETMAGKGNEIGTSFEQIASIIKLVNNKRVGVCLDTCHTWDAGYNIKKFDLVLNEFDKKIGLDKLLVIHLNDSKNDQFSHKDRHENIGRGYIGLNACKNIYKNKRTMHIPKILETPQIADKPIYKAEIKLLKN